MNKSIFIKNQGLVILSTAKAAAPSDITSDLVHAYDIGSECYSAFKTSIMTCLRKFIYLWDLGHDLLIIGLNSYHLQICLAQLPSEWSFLDAGFLPLLPIPLGMVFTATSLCIS